MRLKNPFNLLVLPTFGVWALAAASVVFWGLKLTTSGPAAAVAPAASASVLQADTALVAKALGASKLEPTAVQAPPAASRFSLIGVVSAGSKNSVALIAVDSKPAKAVRVGKQVDEGLWLQSVQRRSVNIGIAMDAPVQFSLELPGVRK
jgi:general secretion pathway protein C